MNPILKQVTELGQSIWYDNIQRSMLTSGEMQALIDDGVVGVTSNPSIFEKAIAKSNDYDDQIGKLAAEGKSTEEIYDALTLDDIAKTADLFRPVYDRTNGQDGYVSLEVNPKIASDTEKTVSEARRLFKTLDRPNVMIKIPGTPEGWPAIETAISEGINVNATLIFSIEAHKNIMKAYVNGLKKYVADGNDPSKIASVASFFVSRVDTVVDKLLEGNQENTDLQGKAAIANTKMAYQEFMEYFSGEEFAELKARGARVQRPLWASTSTKNPNYPKTLYVDTLIGTHTVNTVPPATLDAMRSGMDVRISVTDDLDGAEEILERLEGIGISMSKVTDDLRVAGVQAFADAFDQLLQSIESKRQTMK